MSKEIHHELHVAVAKGSLVIIMCWCPRTSEKSPSQTQPPVSERPLCCEVENLCFSQSTSSLRKSWRFRKRRIIFWNIIKYCGDVNRRNMKAVREKERRSPRSGFVTSVEEENFTFIVSVAHTFVRNWLRAFLHNFPVDISSSQNCSADLSHEFPLSLHNSRHTYAIF